jgi:D-glycero-D-manno-heptose 1,7-bisphosphate phosphatase
VSGPCDCRKPGTLLHRQAAAALALDPARSAFIGDRWRDVAPALAFGGRGILVPSAETPAAEREQAEREAEVAGSLGQAVGRVLGESV